MARKLKIPSQSARHKARLLREHDSRLRSDNLYALEREPLSFAMLTRDRDVAVLRTVSELLLKGCTFAQVQDAVLERHALDLSMDQVRKYRDTCHLLWQNELVSNFHAIVSKELARIAYEQSELWAEWERSKAGSRKHRKEHTESKGEAKSVTYSTESEVEEAEHTGANLKIMERIIELDRERRRLLGIYAPERREVAQSGVPESITISLVGGTAQAQEQ